MVEIKNNRPYVLEYDFPFPEILKPYIEYKLFIEYNKYRENKEGKNIGVDMELKDVTINETLNKLISEVIHDKFIVDFVFIFPTTRIYIQDNNQYFSRFHNHIHTPGNICTTFYYNIPKEGGEIIFRNSKFPNGELVVKPKPNKIYLFPKWLDHSPLPQKDKLPRICFNWDYPGIIRPVHKETQVIW